MAEKAPRKEKKLKGECKASMLPRYENIKERKKRKEKKRAGETAKPLAKSLFADELRRGMLACIDTLIFLRYSST